MTFLGIDNNGNSVLEQTHVAIDAINANNDLINDYGSAIENEIKHWLDDVNRIFGRNIKIEAISKPVSSTYESGIKAKGNNKEDQAGGTEDDQ